MPKLLFVMEIINANFVG